MEYKSVRFWPKADTFTPNTFTAYSDFQNWRNIFASQKFALIAAWDDTSAGEGAIIKMRIGSIRVIVFLFCLLIAFIPFPSIALDQFQSEQAAQKHCQMDTVVWLNLPSGVFHYKGQRWYGQTMNGAYVCEKEALKEGDRATRNGQ